MNLREPKKKKRVKLKPQLPFPIPLNGKQEWPVYTAHLTDMGSCIIEPEEINAVHSMVSVYFINFHRGADCTEAKQRRVNISIFAGIFWERIIIAQLSFVRKSKIRSSASGSEQTMVAQARMAEGSERAKLCLCF